MDFGDAEQVFSEWVGIYLIPHASRRSLMDHQMSVMSKIYYFEKKGLLRTWKSIIKYDWCSLLKLLETNNTQIKVTTDITYETHVTSKLFYNKNSWKLQELCSLWLTMQLMVYNAFISMSSPLIRKLQSFPQCTCM